MSAVTAQAQSSSDRYSKSQDRTDEDVTHRLLQAAFRVHQFNDIHERASTLGLRLPLGQKRRERLMRIRRAGVLFVHVPKNAGTSICDRLYGRVMMHESARYYRHILPDSPERLPSFAIWRDPVERFVSAYAFARRGGTSRVHIHPHVKARYEAFRSLDDALDHVEQAQSAFQLDHVFRPQSWYVCDDQGALLVDALVPMNSLGDLHHYIPALRNVPVPHLNRNEHEISVTDAQRARICRFYASDLHLGRDLSTRNVALSLKNFRTDAILS